MICAVCWVDPLTKQRGTNNTTEICPDCRARPENDAWDDGSALEARGFNLDDFAAGSQTLPPKNRLWRGRSKFDTDAARAVTKHIAKGLKLADAAREAGVGIDFAKRISAYWKKHCPVRLKGLTKHLK